MSKENTPKINFSENEKVVAVTEKQTAPTVTTPAVTAAPTTALSRQQLAINSFRNQLSNYEKQILPDLLKEHNISPARFVKTVLSEIKKNEKLLEAFMVNPASMFASILAGAEVGLIPSDLTGEFYLIPRSVKQSNGQYKLTVTPLIGYKGLVSILLRSGHISTVRTEIVYKEDTFEITYGLEPNLIHIPNFKASRKAIDIIGAYAVCKMQNGESQFSFITRDEIQGVRNISKYENDLYFNDTSGINRWMERKTALNQLAKMLPKDYYSKTGIGIDNMLEGGAYITLDENGNEIKVIDSPSKRINLRTKNIYQTINDIQEND